LYRGIRLLGNILDKEETANHLADSLQQLYARISDSTENQIKYRTIMLVSMDPLRVVGGMGILNEMIDKSGGMNVMADKKEAFPEVTPEEILKAEPEFLIMPFPNNQAYADLLALYPTLYNTPAEVYKQVRVVDPDLFFRFGPRIFDGFLTLTHILHTRLNPEEFRHQDSEG
jgi:ABC-type Fe3+-hydroxamate transport system substrate-binding protein